MLPASLSLLASLSSETQLLISTSQKVHPQPATMAETDGPKMDIPLRAAKGVSQFFLYEALRTGCDELDNTSSQLGTARVKAEKILAKESPVEFESLIHDVGFFSFVSLQ